MYVSLRNYDAAVSRDAHNRKGIHPRLTEPSEHCMAKGVNHKVLAQSDKRTGLVVMIDRGHEVAISVPVCENQLANSPLLTVQQHLGCPAWQTYQMVGTVGCVRHSERPKDVGFGKLGQIFSDSLVTVTITPLNAIVLASPRSRRPFF
jgi:hypothetical protein